MESYSKSNGFIQAWKTGLDANDSTAQETLGAIRMLEDGRKFRYVKMTGAACTEGMVLVPAAVVSISSAATGGAAATDNVVTVTGATYTTNAYIGYYFKVATGGTGSEEARKIIANTATTLTLERPLGTAASSDSAEIIAPKGVVVKCTASDLDITCSGIAWGPITQDYFGWIQISGYATVISTSALTEGQMTSTGGATTAGCAADYAAANDDYIGTCVAAGTATGFQLVNLAIPE
jgi:hypothetical protein